MDAAIIIPTFNRCDVLIQTLGNLSKLDYPESRWELVVVDDGSNDNTEMAVRTWINCNRLRARYIRQENSGPAKARNLGVAATRAEVLVFIDNDILVQPDFLQKHVEAITKNRGCWIMGRIAFSAKLLETPFGRYRASLTEKFYDLHSSNKIEETNGITAANLSLPISDFNRLGAFDEKFTIASSEDWDLGIRAREMGIKVLYHPGITVVHNDWAVSLEKFCERQMLYSVSDVLLWQKYGRKSPRFELIRQNAAINWKEDSLLLATKKIFKYLLATAPARKLVTSVCHIAERWAPDSVLNYRLYNLAVGVAIFRGVREGFRRYGN